MPVAEEDVLACFFDEGVEARGVVLFAAAECLYVADVYALIEWRKGLEVVPHNGVGL